MSNIKLGISQSKGYENVQIVKTQKVANQTLTIYGTEENPLFLATDVKTWIEHSHITKMLSSVDDEEKVKHLCTKSTGVLQANTEYWFLTEDGLYEVLMQSRKPIAKTFKKEVKKILKDIRKHGMYAKDEILDNPDLLIQVATQLKQERERNKQLELTNAVLTQQNGELKPKADYTDMVLKNKGLVTITAIAKDYGMSGGALNKKLHELGIQYKQGGQWFLYSKYHDKGYTSSETNEIVRSNGMKDIVMNTKWTQKGRLFIYNELKEIGIVPLIEQDLAS